MSRYYQIINGKRYNDSLIINGLVRVRKKGDGRISLKDARELWNIAMDGGRITEVEENTLDYLMQEINWTRPALKWMQEELAKDREKLKSYYKVMDGLRYDRKILEAADERTKKAGDGRISKDDAEMLWPLFEDFGNISIIEERTLQYLLENYKWTSAAENWFLDRAKWISRDSHVAPLLRSIMQGEYDFKKLGFSYCREEALQQMLDFENRVTLPIALRSALHHLLNSTDPLSFGEHLPKYSSKTAREVLEGGRLVLLPGDLTSAPSLNSFPSPPNGESLAQNWIFGLELFDLTDDVFWVIVSRDGQKKTYNYVGGPNYAEEWPPTTRGKRYFTIQVLSCDIPYPGITVDVRDPQGKYTISKSDPGGQVRICGPAGTYSIFASDGWSYQSKSFEWDGKGKKQVKNIVLDC